MSFIMKSENAFPELKWKILCIGKKLKMIMRKFALGLVSGSTENGKERKW